MIPNVGKERWYCLILICINLNCIIYIITWNKFKNSKVVNPYEYIDEWKKFNETSLPKKKKGFYSNLNIQNITDADYLDANRVCKDFE